MTPLILFAASPGTITGVITIAANRSGMGLPVMALVGLTAAVGVTWTLLVAATRFGEEMQSGGLFHDVATRFMGLLVLAMGVPFAIVGCRAALKIG